MKFKQTLIINLFFILLISSCSASSLDTFHNRIEKRTIYKESYKDVIGNIFGHVIYLSINDLQTMEKLWCKKIYCTPENLKKRINRTTKKNKNRIVFFAAIYTRKPTWNNLEQSDSLFKIKLIQDKRIIKPLQIKKQNRQALYFNWFFPFYNDFFEPYTIAFPKDKINLSKSVKLIISGVPGTLEYHINLNNSSSGS